MFIIILQYVCVCACVRVCAQSYHSAYVEGFLEKSVLCFYQWAPGIGLRLVISSGRLASAPSWLANALCLWPTHSEILLAFHISQLPALYQLSYVIKQNSPIIT